MKEEGYMTDRLDDQINWYDKKSTQNQSMFKRLRITEIVIATLIPVFGLIFEVVNFEQSLSNLLFGGLGIVITAIASIASFGKYQELWQSYRVVCESLKKEKFLYLAEARPYDKPERFSLLVERVESLISKENTNWSELLNSKGNEGKS